jgi:hypothetical protein
MRQADIERHITVEKPDNLVVPPEEKRAGWIAMISHLGNWELFSHLSPLLPEYRFGTFYQRLANRYIDRHIRHIRARSGTELFDRRESYLRSIAFLREGGVVGVLVDQFAGYAGIWTPLFGRLASCSPLAATLSTRTGLPILPIAIYTIGIARWRVVASEPIAPDLESPDAVESLTARINRELELQIAQSPADWLWGHNRWKPLRPHFLLARDQRRSFFPPEFDQAKLEPFRILIRSPDSEAEASASLPALRAIRKGRPDLWLAVLAPEPLTEFWQQTTLVDLIISFEDSEPIRLTAQKVRHAARFDSAVLFSDAPRAVWEAFLARIPLRVGPAAGLRRLLLHQYFPLPAHPPGSVSYYLQAAQSIGANVNNPEY